MPNTLGRTNNQAKINSRWLLAVDRLLIAGMKLGPTGKHDAINKVLELVPEWTRGDCWQRIRKLRKTAEIPAHEKHPSCSDLDKSIRSSPVRRLPSLPWTPADDDRLLNWAGYEPVKKIAQRLGRSVGAVRFRLAALGMSAKVTDGWSQRGLRQLLRVSPARLRHLIGNGMLRVRDSRISATSFALFFYKNRSSLVPCAIETIAAALAKGDDAYTWERTADLLGVAVVQVQNLICGGQLKLVDTFVTDRSFEEFCKKHGDELNTALMDPATAKWLVEEYGVPETAHRRGVSRAQRHVLTIRSCKCGRKIAGNVYFKHIRYCRFAGEQAIGKAV